MKEKLKFLIPGIGMIYCLSVIGIGLSNGSDEYSSIDFKSETVYIKAGLESNFDIHDIGQNYKSVPLSQEEDYLIQLQALINSKKELGSAHFRP